MSSPSSSSLPTFIPSANYNSSNSTDEGINATDDTIAETNTPSSSRTKTLALVTGTDDFFFPINNGFHKQCEIYNGIDSNGSGSNNNNVTCTDTFDEMGRVARRVCKGNHVTCEHITDSRYTTEALNITVNMTYHKHFCLAITEWLVYRGDVDGIAIRCPYRRDMPPIISIAKEQFNIPIVVYSGPHEQLGPYVSYVGTDHVHMGKTIARLLKQLRPEGGTYLATYNDARSAERFHGFKEEIEKDNNRDDKAHWIETPINYTELNPYPQKVPICYTGPYLGWDPCGYRGITRLGYDGIPFFLDLFHKAQPTAIIFLYQFPMRHHNYTDFVDAYRHLNISYIGVDGTADNLNYMTLNYVDGLVGEQTYEMGILNAKAIYKAVFETNTSSPSNKTGNTITATITTTPLPDVYPTKLINYNLVPEELPPLDVDQSLLGNVRIIGFTCFSIVTCGVLICALWTLYHRQSIVVKASQPFFLVMTATGIFVMASTMIPLSFDDNGDTSQLSHTRAMGICMSIPWLGFSGFCITFSALFSKTYRVNQFFKSNNSHGRIRVSEREVLLPFIIIFSLNVIVLLCWTLIDPLIYERNFSDGTDLWNREIASIGRCQSQNGALPYLVPLGLSKFIMWFLFCI